MEVLPGAEMGVYQQERVVGGGTASTQVSTEPFPAALMFPNAVLVNCRPCSLIRPLITGHERRQMASVKTHGCFSQILRSWNGDHRAQAEWEAT